MALPTKEALWRIKPRVPHGYEPRGGEVPGGNRVADSLHPDAHAIRDGAAGNLVGVCLDVRHAAHHTNFMYDRKSKKHCLQMRADSGEGDVMSVDRPYAAIGARLEALRHAMSDESQREWAERHGFSPSRYNNWAKGRQRISVESAEKLCETYGLTLDAIYRGRLDGLPENLRKVFASALPIT